MWGLTACCWIWIEVFVANMVLRSHIFCHSVTATSFAYLWMQNQMGNIMKHWKMRVLSVTSCKVIRKPGTMRPLSCHEAAVPAEVLSLYMMWTLAATNMCTHIMSEENKHKQSEPNQVSNTGLRRNCPQQCWIAKFIWAELKLNAAFVMRKHKSIFLLWNTVSTMPARMSSATM
jgi:hypothetical protein